MENNSYRGSFIHHSGWIQTLLGSLEGKKAKKKIDVYNREPNFWSLSKTNKKEAIAAASSLHCVAHFTGVLSRMIDGGFAQWQPKAYVDDGIIFKI